MDTPPPNLCTNSAPISNDSCSPNRERNEPLFYTQDKETLSILEELEQLQGTSIMGSDRISGCFCSGTAFNLSKKVLSDMEIKILEKGLDYFIGTHFHEFKKSQNFIDYFAVNTVRKNGETVGHLPLELLRLTHFF